jgi:hypothetical protein
MVGKMKKIIALVLAALFVVTVFAAGCTTTSTTQNKTATPIPSGGQSTGGDKSSYLTSTFSQSYDIISPFKKTTNAAGAVVYSGVVTDKWDKLNPYKREVTIEVTKDRNTTKARFAAIKSDLIKQGYVEAALLAGDDYWYGIYGGRGGLADDMEKVQMRVYLAIREPNTAHIFIGYDGYNYSLGEYNVVVSKDTKA